MQNLNNFENDFGLSVNPQSMKSLQVPMHVTPILYFETATKLASMIHESGFEFDHILCSARDETYLGSYLSSVFRKPLATMYTSFDEHSILYQRGLDGVKHCISIDRKLGSKVLFVDDFADAQSSFDKKLAILQEMYPCVEFRTAVLWIASCEGFKPIYSAQIVGKHTQIDLGFKNRSPEMSKQVAKKYADKVAFPKELSAKL